MQSTSGNYAWTHGKLQPPNSELRQIVHHATSLLSDPWEDIGLQPTLKVWRIHNMRISPWPAEENGFFFDANVFIVLSTRFDDVMSSHLSHNIHVWVGKHASTEDFNTAVFQVLDLEEKLVGEAIVHREASGRESEQFKQYFNPLTISRGCASKSYRYNQGEAGAARLYRFYRPVQRTDDYRVKEVATEKGKLQTEFSYIMDIGQQIYLWTGSMVSPEERMKAIKYCESIVAKRGPSTKLELLDEDGSEQHYFHFYLQNNSEGSAVLSDDELAADVTRQATLNRKTGARKTLYSLYRHNGVSELRKLKTTTMKKQDVVNQLMLIVDNGFDCYVYLGRKATPEDKGLSLLYAHDHLKRTKHPLVPVTVIKGNQQYPPFNRIMST